MTIPIIFVLDASGSMAGDKIRAVNTAMAAVKDIFSSMNCTESVQIGVISFSSKFKWITNEMVDISTYEHVDMNAGGLTDLGSAIEELGKRMTPQDLLCDMDGGISKPIVIFMSDGIPTDDWERKLEEAEKNPWFSKSVRMSIVVGDDADESVMDRLTDHSARCVCIQTPEEIIGVLKSIFYYSVADGYSQLDESSAVKSSRIIDKVIGEQMNTEQKKTNKDPLIEGKFVVTYPSRGEVPIKGSAEIKRCQIIACLPQNAQDTILKLKDEGDWLSVTNMSELPLIASVFIAPLECRRIPHHGEGVFEILAEPHKTWSEALAIKVDIDALGYMSITNNSEFSICIRHSLQHDEMLLRQDDVITTADSIQVLKVVKGGKTSDEWDDDVWD